MQELTQDKWREVLDKSENAVILDVRTPQECSEGVIPNAIEIDILNPDSFMSEIEKLDKDKDYFIYCRSGNRSGQACNVMEQMGFNSTYNLLGGMLEWNGNVKQK
jgi:rhodanese-related sulfurtransferase